MYDDLAESPQAQPQPSDSLEVRAVVLAIGGFAGSRTFTFDVY